MSNLQCHVISNTHWDREWRYPFQAYRMDLVEMMDRLLDILERRPDYRSFFLDSQTVILEDYLEIRPENEDRIRRLVKEDRLQIGPWYTLPDQWGCPGEALVRNLLMGHHTGRRFGPISKVGYTPFSNGQISQLPQLYQGFGIDSCFYYRGVGKHVAKSEFIWEGADGSRLFGFKFGDYARYNYYYLLYRPGLLGRFPEHRDYIWKPEELPYHVAVDQAQDRQYGWAAQQLKVHNENLPRAVADARRFTEADATTNHVLYMMGHDHSFAAEEELDLIEAADKQASENDHRIFHSSLADYMEAFRKEAKDLKVLHGEMRHTNKEGLWTHLMGHILSCRLYLKQRNARVNTKLIMGAEPMAALAWLTGTDYPGRFLERAWKMVLWNHAHDAIGGCSVDPVHEEMLVRWNDVETISDEIIRRSMRDLVTRIDGSSLGKNDLQLTVFNTLATSRCGVAEFIIDLPNGTPDEAFIVTTHDGQALPTQVKESFDYTATIEGGYELTLTFPVRRCRTLVELPDVPALGYQVLAFKRGQSSGTSGAEVVADVCSLENEFLKVIMNDNGTFSLLDKATGRAFENLGVLEDTAEFGDPWNRVTPPDEVPLHSHGVKASVKIVYTGPLEAALRAEYRFTVPAGKGEGKVRSTETVDISVSLTVTLRKGARTVDATLELDNRAKDHRLRVLFPSGIAKATHSFAEGQFDVLERPITLPDATGWKEPPYPTQPMWGFCGVQDGERGFAILNDGLTEYEVIDDEARTIAITLLRGFGKFIYERPTPGSQCLGRHVYRFAICPFAGSWRSADLPGLSARHVVKPYALLSAPSRGELPASQGFLSIKPVNLSFSAIKPGEKPGVVILRCWNPGDADVEAVVTSALTVERAELLTLEELPLRDATLSGDGHDIRFTAGPRKIITLALHIPQLA